MLPFSRRRFLGASGAILALPAVTYRAAFAADTPPSEQVRVASIGVGLQGSSNLKAFVKNNTVAVCDVDKKHLAAAAALVEKDGKRTPVVEEDYRKILDRKDVDAVVVTTPDHWHALQTIHACEAGKDVYCEKPLSLVIAEGRAMVNAARKNKRVVQTGSMQRSAKEFHKACELVRNGAIGQVAKVLVGLPGPNWLDRAKMPAPDSSPPAELNYNLWQGPAPERPYNEKHVHYLFRFFWDYSGGQQTNFGAHDLDITQWGLGMDNSGPVVVEGTATFNKDKWFETPETANITYTYGGNIPVHCTLGKGGNPGGVTFQGTKGTVYVKRGKLEVMLGGLKVADPYAVPGGDVKLYVSTNHHKDWLDCIKSRKLPVCDVEIGHRSATVCHLGNIAVRTGTKIYWDAEKEEIVKNPEAAKLLNKPYREPYKLG